MCVRAHVGVNILPRQIVHVMLLPILYHPKWHPQTISLTKGESPWSSCKVLQQFPSTVWRTDWIAGFSTSVHLPEGLRKEEFPLNKCSSLEKIRNIREKKERAVDKWSLKVGKRTMLDCLKVPLLILWTSKQNYLDPTEIHEWKFVSTILLVNSPPQCMLRYFNSKS